MHPIIALFPAEQQPKERPTVRMLRRGAPSISFCPVKKIRSQNKGARKAPNFADKQSCATEYCLSPLRRDKQ